ncbi:regulator of nonsense transcripts 3A [Microplitis demolitor]|uniref:regulator of nonsense transcripts 3A n=1 Tax=Microplitis demolitor TaxID=69319 RepID=UPI0004CD5FDF|nr:regulator of nonsense transcripts 3A [Microplitis demolitor]
MTEEVKKLDSNPDNSSTNNANPLPAENHHQDVEVSKNKPDNKKEKCKPMTKVVIRRLPPSMSQAQFIDQVSPLPDNDYLHFVKADMSLGQNAFSRAYINFIDQQDIFVFREKFDNYVFVDAKGVEYPAVVEFAPFQRLPKKRVGRKKDPKCGTIEADTYYINFLESLKNQEADAAVPQPKTEYSYQPFDNTQKRVTTTPLLEYLKQRKAEKQRVRDEKREERRRRDIERRRSKDELPMVSKVLKNPEVERDSNRDNKENDKEKILPKDSKNRKREETRRDKVLPARDRDTKTLGKSYRDREDKKHERDNKQVNKKYEDKKSYRRDDYGKEERRESKGSREDAGAGTGGGGGNYHKEKLADERKGKSYEKMRQEKRRLADAKKDEVDLPKDKVREVDLNKCETKKDVTVDLLPSTAGECDDKSNDCKSLNELPDNPKDEKVVDCKFVGSIKTEETNKSEIKVRNVKVPKRRSSLESGGDGGGGDGAFLRRHKSLDGGEEDNLRKNEHEYKDKDKKDPRLERRIRNKDRPAMEIYRPGMGKFSKQRLEREKSNHDDRASSSESPTPSKGSSKNDLTSTSSEVRSMTFKRSVSRDNP